MKIIQRNNWGKSFSVAISMILLVIPILSMGEYIDEGPRSTFGGTQRHNMHACMYDNVVTGLHAGKNWLLCSTDFTKTGEEFVDSTTQYNTGRDLIHTCPQGTVVTGVHLGKNRLLCLPIREKIPYLVDGGSQREGMHACPPGYPLAGIHAGKNLFVCGSVYNNR